jgi:predicted GNAT family acetyltransferase
MNVDANQLVVTHNEAAERFETQIGELLGLVEYKRRGKHIILTHTEVPKALEGQGIAARLSQVALDYARAQHLVVIPLCPFTAAYVRRHREYQDIVHPSYRTPRSSRTAGKAE